MVGSNFLSRRLVNLKLQRALLNGVKKAGNVHELALFTPHHLHEYRINNLFKASVTFIFIPHVFSISQKLKSCISQN